MSRKIFWIIAVCELCVFVPLQYVLYKDVFAMIYMFCFILVMNIIGDYITRGKN